MKLSSSTSSLCYVLYSLYSHTLAHNVPLFSPSYSFARVLFTSLTFLSLTSSSHFFSPGRSSLLSGDPLQFPGHSGGAGETDVQHSGWGPGGLVRIPSCLPPLPHPVRWDSPACVDGNLHWCTQGTPAQRTAQVR